MKKKTDSQVIRLMRRCFMASTQYNRCGSYALKHVLQQVDKEYYLPEWEFVRLMQKAGFKVKGTASGSYKLKVWVVPRPEVSKELWGKGYDLKYIENRINYIDGKTTIFQYGQNEVLAVENSQGSKGM